VTFDCAGMLHACLLRFLSPVSDEDVDGEITVKDG
jgi:hypothetical protein